MTISAEIALRALLVASPAVSSLVADRIFPHMATQATPRPYGIYNRISAAHQRHLRGASGLVFTLVQMDWFSSNYDHLTAIAEAARNCVDGFRGNVTVGAETIFIQQIELTDDRSDYFSAIDSTDSGAFRFTQDFRISIPESIPTLT